MNIYHNLKVSYIIRLVIIKHALVKELLIFVFGKLTYVLKEEDTNIIRGIP